MTRTTPAPEQASALGARVEVDGVGRVFADPQGHTLALQPVSLTVEPGEFVVVVGPSGCGKTTLLRMMAGLEKPTVGRIDVTVASGAAARSAMVFQDKAVFPWLSVLDNVAYGLRVQGVRRRAARRRAGELIDVVGLTDFADALPHQLSGGMKQRVSIARALATDPDVLFMDEPLAALDEQTKTVVQAELLRVWERTGKSVVYVTHSIDEALVLGDRVVVLTARPGRIKTEIAVDLPRPRDVIALRSTPRYAELSRQVWDALRDELHLEET